MSIHELTSRNFRIATIASILSAVLWVIGQILLDHIDIHQPLSILSFCLIAVLPMSLSLILTLISILFGYLLLWKKGVEYRSILLHASAIAQLSFSALWIWVRYMTHSSFNAFLWSIHIAMCAWYIGFTVSEIIKRKKLKHQQRTNGIHD